MEEHEGRSALTLTLSPRRGNAHRTQLMVEHASALLERAAIDVADSDFVDVAVEISNVEGPGH